MCDLRLDYMAHRGRNGSHDSRHLALRIRTRSLIEHHSWVRTDGFATTRTTIMVVQIRACRSLKWEPCSARVYGVVLPICRRPTSPSRQGKHSKTDSPHFRAAQRSQRFPQAAILSAMRVKTSGVRAQQGHALWQAHALAATWRFRGGEACALPSMEGSVMSRRPRGGAWSRSFPERVGSL